MPLPNPHPEIPETVRQAFGLAITSATAVGGGFSGATVFRATTNDGRTLAIRRTPNSAKLPAKRNIRLYGLLSRLAGLGLNQIAVPLIPLTTLQGVAASGSVSILFPNALAPAPEPWVSLEDSRWQVEPWMPGNPLPGIQVTKHHLRSAFRLLNNFHRLAIDALHTTGQDEWFYVSRTESPAIQRRLGIVNELQQGLLGKWQHQLSSDSDPRFRELAARICDALRHWLPWLHQELSTAAAQTYSIQPVLRDVWRAHLLFTDQDVTGLIDLTASGTDHVTVDLSRLIRSWFGGNIQQVRAAAETYRTLRKLDARELKLWQTLDASSVLLSPVTWLRRRFESSDPSDYPDDVISRLRELTEMAANFRPLFSDS